MPPLPTFSLKPGYRAQSEDTNPQVDLFYFANLRQKPLAWRIERFTTLNLSARQLSLFAAQTQPSAMSIRWDYVRRRLGQEWADSLADKQGTVMIIDPLAFAQKVISILESLDIRYYIGGSVASSLWGESRYTEDIDLIIDLEARKTMSLHQSFLDADFYSSDLAMEDAVKGCCSSFNILDQETLEKADLFILQPTSFATVKMDRRIQYALPNGRSIWLSSPEDSVLQKLVWRRDSLSERQWRDILGILKVQGDHLDFGHLRQWAGLLNLAQDLEQALLETGL